MVQYHQDIPSETAEDDTKLKAMAADKLKSDKSSFAITPWTSYYAKIIPKHPENRLVVFKPSEMPGVIGCIRVRERDNTKATLWDVVSKEGFWVGLVPAGCQFEAMVVDVKIVTPT